MGSPPSARSTYLQNCKDDPFIYDISLRRIHVRRGGNQPRAGSAQAVRKVLPRLGPQGINAGAAPTIIGSSVSMGLADAASYRHSAPG
jgi:hypothetical protein